MRTSDTFLAAVRFNKVSVLRPLLDPFDWAKIPSISPDDINRAFTICCQNNYIELAQLLLPKASLFDNHFNGLCWALHKNHVEIIKLIASRIDQLEFTAEDVKKMKEFDVWDKWEEYKLRDILTQTTANCGTNVTPRKM